MHQHITINGKTYTAEEALLLKDRFASEYGEDSFMASLGGFLAEWYKHPASYLGGISNALRDAVGER